MVKLFWVGWENVFSGGCHVGRVMAKLHFVGVVTIKKGVGATCLQTTGNEMTNEILDMLMFFYYSGSS